MKPVLLLVVLSIVTGARASDDLARHFGFDSMRILVVDDGFGPVVCTDMNDDQRPDLVVVNNRKSRIEVHYLRASERTDDQIARTMKANEIPPNPWYDREDISVTHRVAALGTGDFDGDGRTDILYVGTTPSELVLLSQEAPTIFRKTFTRRVRGLSGRQGVKVEVGDILGNARDEVVFAADGELRYTPIDPTRGFGEVKKLGAADDIVAVFIEDYDGDGLSDVLAVSPEATTPLRLWRQRQDPTKDVKSGLLTAEHRFEMPGLREVQPVRFADRNAASIAVIERASRRIILYDLKTGTVDSEATEQDAQVEVHHFPGKADKKRPVAFADLDGNGHVDIVVADAGSNTVRFYPQEQGVGFGRAETFSSFKKPSGVAIGQWDGSGAPEVFVLSEEEKVVGVSSFENDRLAFPVPLSVSTPGGTPVAAYFVEPDGRPTLAVVVKKRRDVLVELHTPENEPLVIELDGVTRAPEAVLSLDADQDGRDDLLLLKPDEVMLMLRSKEGDEPGRPTEFLTDEQMKQFGLVEAAGPTNTGRFDIDADGKDELLIADANFIRACRYDSGRGWRVVEQITMEEQGSKISAISLIDSTRQIVASDAGLKRFVVVGQRDNAWGVERSLAIEGFSPTTLTTGRFWGDGRSGILAVGDDGFALVGLAGEYASLETAQVYRFDSEDRTEHEIEVGDVNDDGYTDLVVLDAGEQMCSILTCSAKRKMYLGTEFEVFQSRLFTRGSGREFEPRAAIVGDANGDGLDDVLLIVHDRVLIYPQARQPG